MDDSRQKRLNLLLEAEKKGRLSDKGKAFLVKARSDGLIQAEPQPEQPTEPAPQADGQAPEFRPPDILGGIHKALNGATLGFYDEYAAGVGGAARAVGNVLSGEPANFSGEYDAVLDGYRKADDELSEAHPVSSALAEIGGGLASGFGGGRALGKAGIDLVESSLPFAQKAGRLIATGSAGGSVSGFGNSEGGLAERAQDSLIGAGVGGAVGLGLPAVGGLVGRQLAKSAATKDFMQKAPTNEQLKAAATAAYDKAHNAGVVFAKDAFAGMADKLTRKLTEAGLDQTLHPRASAALKRIADKSADDVSMKDLEILRRVARAAGSGLDADERRVSNIIIDGIDEFVQNAAEDAVVSGDPQASTQALRVARDQWSKLKKSEILDELFENARNQASGFENGLRIQFRSLLKNKKKLRSFSDAEIAAIEKVARGDKLTNAMRHVARFSPTSGGGATNVMGATVGGGGGLLLGGPIGAAAVPGVGYGAQKLSEKLTREAAERAAALVRSGQVPQVPKTPGLIESFMSTPTSAAAGGGLLANLLAE